jgi:hypothetical protein
MNCRFVSWHHGRFQIGAFFAAFAAVVGLGSGQALASAGCTALAAGTYNAVAFDPHTVIGDPVAAGTGFQAGDVITGSIPAGVSNGIWLADETTSTIVAGTFQSSLTFSYTVPATTTDTLGIQVGSLNGGLTASWSCTPGTANASSDSEKLRALQIAASKLVSQNSGAAISGAVDGAIEDAFGVGGNLVTVGPNGTHINFAAEPVASDVARRANESFAAALPYAGDPMATKAPPGRVVERTWSAWADVRGTGFDRNTSNADLNGTQVNVTAGFARKFTPDLLIGVLTGYENFRYTSTALTGTFKGDGATIGGYTAWRITPTLRWDAALAWSRLWYDAAAGTANGNFTGSRIFGSTGLTGRYRIFDLVAEPSLKVFALGEHQDAWTDSLGTLQASRDFWAGRVSAGGKLLRPWQVTADTTMSPYVGAYADWYFSSDNALPAGLPVVGLADGWSGRVTGGVTVAKRGGGTLSLGGEYGGLGADYKIWTANARALWAF